jgi:hypothetical protein
MDAAQLSAEEQLLLTIDDAEYVAWPCSSVSVSGQDRPSPSQLLRVVQAAMINDYPELLLVTVITLTSDPEPPAHQKIRDWLTNALQTDDVFRKEFLSGVVFCLESGGAIPADGELDDFLKVLGTKWHRTVLTVDPILPDPYVLSRGRLAPVYPLYRDTGETFITSFRPREVLARSMTTEVERLIAN